MTEPPDSPTRGTGSRFGAGVVLGPFRLVRRGLRPFEKLFPWWWRPPRAPEDLDEAIKKVQLDILLREFGEGTQVGAHVGERDDDVYLYRSDRVLVRDGDDLEDLRRFVEERSERYGGAGDSQEVLAGSLHHFVLPPGVDVPTLLNDLDTDLRPDVARPDHVLHVTSRGIGKLCPADEPRLPPTSDPLPAVTAESALGTDVRVSVVDTGLWEPAESSTASPWLGPVNGLDLVDGELDQGVQVGPGTGRTRERLIRSYAGHGTFVAGIVRCLAPATVIRHEAILVKAGAAYESDIVRQLNDAVLDDFQPHIISISAGTYTRHDLGLLAFDVLWHAEERRERTAAVLVVAAAGNDHTQRPFYPAAYDWVVGVGALDEDGAVSCFSNTGSWVDVYAHGRDLVNAFPSGVYRYHEPPNAPGTAQFDGLAMWSGTSFATPIVSGEIAAHMSRTGLTAREAKDDLLTTKYRTLQDASGQDIVAVGPPFA